MRLLKTLLIISTITLTALLYVYQQTQIFYLAYQNDKKQARLQEAIDKNNILRYNEKVLSSLPYIEKKLLARHSDFEIPREQRIVRLDLATQSRAEFVKTNNILVRFFNSITRQAEAKPVNR